MTSESNNKIPSRSYTGSSVLDNRYPASGWRRVPWYPTTAGVGKGPGHRTNTDTSETCSRSVDHTSRECRHQPVLAQLHRGRRLLVEPVAVGLDGVYEVGEDVLFDYRQRTEVLHQDLRAGGNKAPLLSGSHCR